MGMVNELTNELVEPRYESPAAKEVLGPYVREGMQKLRGHYNRLGVKLPPFQHVRAKIENLATYAVKVARGIYKPVGQVFGEYRPGKGELAVDPSVVYDGRRRQLLESFGIKVQPALDVVTHELVHAAHDKQGVFGKLWKYFKGKMRDAEEGLATYVSGRALGRRQGVYPREQELAREYVQRHGERAALLGPYAMAAA